MTFAFRIVDDTDSYYGYPDHDLQPIGKGRCDCDTPITSQIIENVACSNVPEESCGTQDPDVTEEYCTQIPGSSTRRRKRQAEDPEGINDDDVRPIFPNYNVTIFEVS